jgi:PAS domain-containing protein
MVAALGMVSMAGYLIDFQGGFNWGQYTQMSLHTSIGFVVAGSALGVTIIPRLRETEGRKFLLWPYEIILLTTMFFIDLQVPQGVAVGLLYVMPLLASWYFPNRKQIILVAVICNALIGLDVFLATESLDSEAVLYNRVISILAVWVAAVIFYYLKRISEQQQEADLKFKLAVEGTTAGIWDWISVDSNEEWWSPTFYQLLGYENDEIEASLDNFSAFLHPDDSEHTFRLVNRHLTKQAPFITE